eukprot:Rmarinus@m.70
MASGTEDGSTCWKHSRRRRQRCEDVNKFTAEDLASIARLQAVIRGRREREQFKRMRFAVQTLQGVYRSRRPTLLRISLSTDVPTGSGRIVCREEVETSDVASSEWETDDRGFSPMECRRAAGIQRRHDVPKRSSLSREETNNQGGSSAFKGICDDYEATIRLQAVFRTRKERRQYLRLRRAATVLQQCYRARSKTASALPPHHSTSPPLLPLDPSATLPTLARDPDSRRGTSSSPISLLGDEANVHKEKADKGTSPSKSPEEMTQADMDSLTNTLKLSENQIKLLQAFIRGRYEKGRYEKIRQATSIIQSNYRKYKSRSRSRAQTYEGGSESSVFDNAHSLNTRGHQDADALLSRQSRHSANNMNDSGGVVGVDAATQDDVDSLASVLQLSESQIFRLQALIRGRYEKERYQRIRRAASKIQQNYRRYRSRSHSNSLSHRAPTRPGGTEEGYDAEPEFEQSKRGSEPDSHPSTTFEVSDPPTCTTSLSSGAVERKVVVVDAGTTEQEAVSYTAEIGDHVIGASIDTGTCVEGDENDRQQWEAICAVAAEVIQRAYRGHNSRRRHHAAQRIQQLYRRQRRERHVDVESPARRTAEEIAAMRIQNLYRMHRTRKGYISLKTAAISMQKRVRIPRQRKRVHHQERQLAAVRRLQTVFRLRSIWRRNFSDTRTHTNSQNTLGDQAVPVATASSDLDEVQPTTTDASDSTPPLPHRMRERRAVLTLHDRASAASLDNLPDNLRPHFDLERMETCGQFLPIEEVSENGWLAVHCEAGQSFETFQLSRPNAPTESCKTLYLMLLEIFTKIPRFLDGAVVAEFLRTYYCLPVAGLPMHRVSPSLFTHCDPVWPSGMEPPGSRSAQLHAARAGAKVSLGYDSPSASEATDGGWGADCPPLISRTNPLTGNLQAQTRGLLLATRYLLPPEAFSLTALTADDLYPTGDRNFVFGQASLRGRVALVSIARLAPTFEETTEHCFSTEETRSASGSPSTRLADGKDAEDSGAEDSGSETVGHPVNGRCGPAAGISARAGVLTAEEIGLTLRRLCKVAAHEIGHTFGLRHCVYYRCIMNGSMSLNDNDSRPFHLCPICLRKVHSSVRFDILSRYRGLAAFYTKHRTIFGPEAEWADRQVALLTDSALA